MDGEQNHLGEWALDHFFIREDLLSNGIGREMFQSVLRAAQQNDINHFYIITDPFAKGFFEKMDARFIEDFTVAKNIEFPLFMYDV
jgi:N-acetylglutamate synthase-like GNAT family acetyltransferase